MRGKFLASLHLLHLAKIAFLWYPFVDKGDEEEEYAAAGASERGWLVRIPAQGSGRSLRSFRAEAVRRFALLCA